MRLVLVSKIQYVHGKYDECSYEEVEREDIMKLE